MGKALSGELSCPCDRSCSFFTLKPYVVTPHLNRLDETVQTRGHNVCLFIQKQKLSIVIIKHSLLSRSLVHLSIEGMFNKKNHRNGGASLIWIYTVNLMVYAYIYFSLERYGVYVENCKADVTSSPILCSVWRYPLSFDGAAIPHACTRCQWRLVCIQIFSKKNYRS